MPDPTTQAEAIDHLAAAAKRLIDAADLLAAEALGPQEVARLLCISVSQVYTLNTSGLLPEPANIGTGGRLPRWSRRELRLWIEAGAPARARWAQERTEALHRAG
jgi:predicted DNA-binding transcriptional regulator AlpA